MRIAIDRQHRGKPGKPGDLGAGFDLDGDGLIEIHEREGMLTGPICLFAEERSIELGHEVFQIGDGWYPERHKRANELDVEVYAAMHLNNGGGNYGAIFYHYLSKHGPKLAECIGEVLRDMADELTSVKMIPARPDDWTKNAFATISGIAKPIAICYEPAFMDSPDHAPLFLTQGQRRLGSALAEGIDMWSKL